MPTLAERLEGGLLGLLIGDALGVPYEFYPPQALPPVAELEFTPPPGFRRSHASVSPGTWSGDGAQALALLASLLAQDTLDLDKSLDNVWSPGIERGLWPSIALSLRSVSRPDRLP